ncbi:filamentous hemagglutinin N-terminal domain-containing protein [Nostoc flagelliforme FACHB-838]|uniref:Filamentous hemagglutinin N-terminal domain-containing protein n=1 Tax=Nostoc flagelliforme FACHB-838 TaxID=2692904 RepID=A0ABR8DTZ1_9NOSO|nr:filamentous hemagglutinin N-terminal domain-containing protein [Nostoc flagelliforme]MBD2532851.1 filamentous hemagglutinin N-terminal domain-containing protein [Nostoc flagelliforme FACHB-838]
MQHSKRSLLSNTLPLSIGVNFALALFSCIAPCPAKAQITTQITPDATLGDKSSVVVKGKLEGSDIEQINGGAIQGSNLFHSFKDFNVGEGGKAYFTNPGEITNILTRVTGGNPSNILGTLGVLGQANLFFINPNGIVFGPNALLNMGGSFVASTADSLVFDNGLEFSATNPLSPPLLTVNIPVGLRLRENSASIVNQSSAVLYLPSGNTLGLVGGNVILDGGSLGVPEGRIELGGLTETGIVGFNVQESQGIPRVASLSFPNSVEQSDVSLSKQAVVNVAGKDGGSIAINGRNVNVLGGSRLLAGIGEGLGSPEAQAGNIEINATDKVVFSGSPFGVRSSALNQVGKEAEGNSGGIDIKARTVEVTDGGYLEANTIGKGNSGTIRVTATDKVVFSGSPLGFRSSALSQVGKEAVGNSGGIEIDAGSVEVTDGGYLEANTIGKGNSGTIRVTAADNVVFDGESSLGFRSSAFSQVEQGAVGNSGGIEIDVGSVAITKGAQLSASTSGQQGNAGKISITARDEVLIDGESENNFLSTVFSQVEQGAVGNSGGIEIDAGSVAITKGAQLSASTSGQGDAGKISITARDRVLVYGESENNFLSTVFSQVEQGAVGKSDGIEINAGSVAITKGAQLSASTSGEGDAGKISITARDRVLVDGESEKNFRSTVLSQVEQGAVGKSDGIEINTPILEVTNGGSLDASTKSSGNAGTISINATDKVIFDGESSSNLRTYALSQVFDGANGKSGGIVITTPILKVTNGAFLDASTRSSGDAGTISITASDKVIFDGESSQGNGSAATSQVTQTAEGKSGGIEINAPILRVINGAELNTTTLGKGNSGAIRVAATDSVVVDGRSDRSLVSAIASEVGIDATGASEGITINAPRLQISNAAIVSANTNGNGNAGNIDVTADTIELSSAGKIRTNTSASSKAGNITLNVPNSLTLSDFGTAVLAETENTSTSDGGNIFVIGSPKNVLIQNGAALSVNSRGSGIGGDISLEANSLTLEQGTISAETAKERGGNISLKVADLLLMQDDSKITTNAGIESQPGAIGTGGNITINTQFLVAPPSQPKGSDITANATYGDGGRVDITATSIFGIEFGDKPRDLLNDITASSELGGNPGVVNINLGINSNQNLVELPANVVDPNDQIAQNPCSKGVASEFTITGRGGLPPSPNEDLSQEATQVALVEPVSIVSNVKPPQKASSSDNSKSQIPSPIVPVKGWVFNNKGEVILTAYNPNVTGTHRLPKNLSSCPAR